MNHQEGIVEAAQKAVDSAVASREAVHAARNAAQAVEVAREAQLASAVAEAIKNVFAVEDSGGQKRFVDITRVPLICQSIVGIDTRLKTIETNVTWGVRIIIGAVMLGVMKVILIP